MAFVHTLRGRLLTIALLWCGLFLLGLGFSLQSMLHGDWQAAEADSLRVQMDELLVRLKVDSAGRPVLSEPLADPRFLQPRSGYYWQLEQGDVLVGRSRSLGEQRLPSTPPAKTLLPALFSSSELFHAKGARREPLLVMTRRAMLPQSARVVTLVLAKNSRAFTRTLNKMRLSLLLGFGLAAVGLVLGLVLQVGYGLQPLRVLRRELARLHQGEQEGFTQRYPQEIQPLVDDINRLLHRYGELLGRARTHTGNLAHALKTPLSVLRNQVAELDSRQQAALTEQLDHIQRHIDYHLGKARITGAARVLGVSTPLRARIEYICRAFSRLYPDKVLDIDVPAQLAVGVEEQDFDEMVGNVLENAFKWAQANIRISTAELGGWISLRIEDDGPGMSEGEIAQAVLRGVRLDERVPGSGLGLNIVTELAKAYQGSFIMGRAELGGLAASLSLPKVARLAN
ncbi:MAG: ATP-binding protein [Aeromonas sp.]